MTTNYRIAKTIMMFASIMAITSCSASYVQVIDNQELEQVSNSSKASQQVDFNDIQCNDIRAQVMNGYRVANLVEEYRIQNPLENLNDFYIWDANTMSLDDSNKKITESVKLKKIVASASCASYKVIFQPNMDFSIHMGSSYTGGSLQKLAIQNRATGK